MPWRSALASPWDVSALLQSLMLHDNPRTPWRNPPLHSAPTFRDLEFGAGQQVLVSAPRALRFRLGRQLGVT